jgi:hypothetical protein
MKILTIEEKPEGKLQMIWKLFSLSLPPFLEIGIIASRQPA